MPKVLTRATSVHSLRMLVPNTERSRLKNVRLALQYRDYWQILELTNGQHYNHIANENRAKNALEYRQWIESHTAVVIYEANQARAKLNKLEKRRWLQLQDDRKVRKNRSAYQFFFMERIHSGDFSGIGVSDTTRRVAQEWKALSVSEKEVQ